MVRTRNIATRTPVIASVPKRIQPQANHLLPLLGGIKGGFTAEHRDDTIKAQSVIASVRLRRTEAIRNPLREWQRKLKYERQYFVYFLTNRTNVVLYIGVTNDLIRRVYEHRNKLFKGFTQKYDVFKLVYYEVFSDPGDAILREKRLKGSSRARKNKLVESMNPEWKDLWYEIIGEE